MATEIKKLKDLNYNTTITLGVIQQDQDLMDIFTEQIKMPFNILFRLSEEGSLNDRTKELLNTIFEKIILTKRDLIDKYLRLADNSGVIVNKDNDTTEHIEEEIEVTPPPVELVKQITPKPKKQKTGKELPRIYGKEKIEKDIEKQNGVQVTQVEETKEVVVEVKKDITKKTKALPRRYGKAQINKDIQNQNGKATNAQLTALAVNDLKNLYVNLSNRMIHDMLSGSPVLTDEEYREIRSTITILKNKMKPILKKTK